MYALPEPAEARYGMLALEREMDARIAEDRAAALHREIGRDAVAVLNDPRCTDDDKAAAFDAALTSNGLRILARYSVLACEAETRRLTALYVARIPDPNL